MFRFKAAAPEHSSLWISTYLHDELDRAHEEAEELENKVLLLLLHLVETIFAAALGDLLGCETDASVGLEHVLGDNTAATGGDIFLLLELQNQLLVLDANRGDEI
jgi:hypothetical protein